MSVYNEGKPLFPAFFDLSDAEVLVVGRGAEADRKAEKMAPFCRRVVRCDYPPVFWEKPALAILAEPGHPDNAHWAARFREMGVPVNVCDRPELCDFRFPALITRGAVTVGIATAGAAPVLAGLLRQKIDAALPDDLEAIFDMPPTSPHSFAKPSRTPESGPGSCARSWRKSLGVRKRKTLALGRKLCYDIRR